MIEMRRAGGGLGAIAKAVGVSVYYARVTLKAAGCVGPSKVARTQAPSPAQIEWMLIMRRLGVSTQSIAGQTGYPVPVVRRRVSWATRELKRDAELVASLCEDAGVAPSEVAALLGLPGEDVRPPIAYAHMEHHGDIGVVVP